MTTSRTRQQQQQLQDELLLWVNAFLQCDYSNVSQLSDGIAFCQLIDALCPSLHVPLSTLNFNATSEGECEENLRVFKKYCNQAKPTLYFTPAKVVKGSPFEITHILQELRADLVDVSGSSTQRYKTKNGRYPAESKRRKALVKQGDFSFGVKAELSPGVNHHRAEDAVASPRATSRGTTQTSTDSTASGALMRRIVSAEKRLIDRRQAQLRRIEQLEDQKHARDHLWKKAKTIEELCAAHRCTVTDRILDILTQRSAGF